MATSDIQGDIEQTKRRQAAPAAQLQVKAAPSATSPSLPNSGRSLVGVMLTSEQIKAGSDAAAWERSRQRQDAFKQGVSNTLGGIGDAMGQVARTVTTTAGAGLGALRNTTFDSNLPDHRWPSQKALAADKSQQFNPQQQAGAIGAFDMAQRAVDAGLKRPISGVMRPSAGLQTVAPLDSAASGPAGRTGAVASGGAPGGQPSAPTADQPAPDVKAQPGGLGQWSRTSIGAGRDGGEIVGRMGANGVPEFSNREADVKGAGAQRAVGRVGNGIGGVSQGTAGDSALAMERFRRANEIRAGMLDEQRGLDAAHGIVPGVRGVGGGFDGMDLARQRRLADISTSQGLKPGNRQRAMKEALQQQLASAGLGLSESELRQQGIDAGLDRSMRERELAETQQRNALEAQETQQDIEKGRIDLGVQSQEVMVHS